MTFPDPETAKSMSKRTALFLKKKKKEKKSFILDFNTFQDHIQHLYLLYQDPHFSPCGQP
jgi:hypothetical protein